MERYTLGAERSLSVTAVSKPTQDHTEAPHMFSMGLVRLH